MSKQRTKGRPIDGILLLNKPTGCTSNAALQMIKRLFDARKAGHTGSLDPLASGMLPICFGEATKFSQFLLESDKQYEVTGELGKKTATGDAEGPVISERPIPDISQEILEKVFAQFTGAIQQIPSMYSAIKQNGQPLYKLARQGLEVERPAREVQIYSLQYVGHNATSFSFRVHCSKGTYIRTLVEDMGEALGCGAYVKTLHRLSVGPYLPENMHTFEALEKKIIKSEQAGEVVFNMKEVDECLLPIDSALDWPKVSISEAAWYYLKQGQPVIIPYAPSEGWLNIHHKDGRFLGVGEVLSNGRVAPRRLVAT